MSAPKGTALITGASTGIGAVYADRLAKRGYDLILVARNEERLSESAARLKSTGRRIETIVADLTNKGDVQRIAERLSTDPTITALVNNAGLGSARKLLDEKKAASAEKTASRSTWLGTPASRSRRQRRCGPKTDN